MVPVNTLQLFITNRCNLRCKGCFYAHKLGAKEMSLREYQDYILKYLPEIQKVILLGGEPTMHKNLPQMLKFNNQYGLKTTIYSTGFNLEQFKGKN
ncbi:MAG: 4Fe-4S cluster-binding domain-containing protein, partial [Patescibacteria group bacterium]|nr:4Fe-4S cluster-binding domain-containing protein [Patescibacteria group bacterium]